MKNSTLAILILSSLLLVNGCTTARNLLHVITDAADHAFQVPENIATNAVSTAKEALK